MDEEQNDLIAGARDATEKMRRGETSPGRAQRSMRFIRRPLFAVIVCLLAYVAAKSPPSCFVAATIAVILANTRGILLGAVNLPFLPWIVTTITKYVTSEAKRTGEEFDATDVASFRQTYEDLLRERASPSMNAVLFEVETIVDGVRWMLRMHPDRTMTILREAAGRMCAFSAAHVEETFVGDTATGQVVREATLPPGRFGALVAAHPVPESVATALLAKLADAVSEKLRLATALKEAYKEAHVAAASEEAARKDEGT